MKNDKKKKVKDSNIPHYLRFTGEANDQHMVDLWAFQSIVDPENNLTREQIIFYADEMVREYFNKQKQLSSNFNVTHHYYSSRELHKGPRTDRDQMLLPGSDWGF
jgi:hypothetical protein